MYFVHLVAPELKKEILVSPSSRLSPFFTRHHILHGRVYRCNRFPSSTSRQHIPPQEGLSRCFTSLSPWDLAQHLDIVQNEIMEMYFLKLNKEKKGAFRIDPKPYFLISVCSWKSANLKLSVNSYIQSSYTENKTKCNWWMPPIYVINPTGTDNINLIWQVICLTETGFIT